MNHYSHRNPLGWIVPALSPRAYSLLIFTCRLGLFMNSA